MGLGGQLLRFVLKLAAKMADEVGCAGVVVDAKPGGVAFYAKYGFTPFELRIPAMPISDSGRSRSLVPGEADQSARDDAGVHYIARLGVMVKALSVSD